jgi:hypothetical protein
MSSNYMPYQDSINSELNRKHKETNASILERKAKTKLLSGLVGSVTGRGNRRKIGSKDKADEYLS